MDYQNYSQFFELVSQARDSTLEQLAGFTSGKYGESNDFVRIYRNLCQNKSDQKDLAALLVMTTDFVLSNMSKFVEEQVGKSISLSILDNGNYESVTDVDMFHGWMMTYIQKHSKANADTTAELLIPS